jgi:RNA-directed DNA polymerase
MSSWRSHLYKFNGNAQGRARVTLLNALVQAQKVQARGLPAILTLGHLSKHVGVPYLLLREVVRRKRDTAYREFPVAKRSGGWRRIYVPEPSLLRTQRWISRYVLANLTPHSASVAYVRESSVFKAAEMHCRCQWLIKVDIQDFFESISERQVYLVYLQAGYQPLVAFELARLCTWVFDEQSLRYRRKRWRTSPERRSVPGEIGGYRDSRIGHLPQGAPTSPMLSNLVMAKFDAAAEAIALSEGCVYTRYSDDLSISSDASDFGRSRAENVVRELFALMRGSGFEPNPEKTVIAPPGARKIVLGLLVDSDRPRLRREFKSRLEAHVHGLVKFGPVQHARQRDFKSIFGMKRHLYGLLTYAEQIDSAFAEPLRKKLDSVVWPGVEP